MTHTSAFKTPEGEAAYLAAYDAAMHRVNAEGYQIPFIPFAMTEKRSNTPVI